MFREKEEYVPYRQVPQVADKKFLHQREAGFDVIFLQTVAVALLSFLALAVLGYVWRWRNMWQIASTVAVVLTLVYWLLSLVRWNVNSWVESATGLDLNHDGVIGKQEAPQRASLRVTVNTVKENGHYQSQVLELPGEAESLARMAAGVLRGLPFTESQWAGKNKPFSVPEFRELRGLMLKRGLAEYVNAKAPQQGIVLSASGKAVFEGLAEGEIEYEG